MNELIPTHTISEPGFCFARRIVIAFLPIFRYTFLNEIRGQILALKALHCTKNGGKV